MVNAPADSSRRGLARMSRDDTRLDRFLLRLLTHTSAFHIMSLHNSELEEHRFYNQEIGGASVNLKCVVRELFQK